jgi:hypothetical protein
MKFELLGEKRRGRVTALLLEGSKRPWKHGLTSVVSRFYKTDFASVPRLLWWAIPPLGRYAEAAVHHDRAYEKQKLWDDENQTWVPITRLQADDMMRSFMREDGVSRAERACIYWAIRAFGGAGWQRYTDILNGATDVEK